MEDIKKIKTRINWMCKDKINAFSPTISPAPKNEERQEIESIVEGVKYYYKRGVREFIFQQKYMGSYCDIYLHKNIEDTYFVSRNGHRINHIDVEKAKQACELLHAKLDWTNTTLMIIQAELLPWSILGKGLIDNEFAGYLHAHQNHLEYLNQSNLYQKIETVKNSAEYITYDADQFNLSNKELKAKYSSHIIRQYDAIKQFKVLQLDNYKQGIDIYAEQINHFGKEEELYFKPFCILKKIMDDGSEQMPNDNFTYQQVNDDECMALTLTDNQDIETAVKPIYEWFARLSASLVEGIMIKPKQTFIHNLPPAFKVRNNQYLTMIYGVNFINDLQHNIAKRQVGKKTDCSKNDWMINWELLKTKYTTITTENYAYKNLLLDRIFGELLENNLDHRL
jgi:PNKP adenylyltransferase domain, ligase domain